MIVADVDVDVYVYVDVYVAKCVFAGVYLDFVVFVFSLRSESLTIHW